MAEIDKVCYPVRLGLSHNFERTPMNVSLTPQLERLVHQKVKSGAYLSASEVVREGLRLLQERDAVREFRLAELRKEIQIGLDQLERGEGVTLDEEGLKKYMDDVKERGRRRLAKRKKP